MAVSQDGAVYVTGAVEGGYKSALDYGTVAYDAAAGAQLWTARYTGPGARDDQACCVAVSPNASMIFVTGFIKRSGHGTDYATVAYHR